MTSRFANYQSQEKDDELNGVLNFELRQYDPRIGRWFNPDPMGQYHSPYLAMGNNPISFVDPTGGEAGIDPACNCYVTVNPVEVVGYRNNNPSNNGTYHPELDGIRDGYGSGTIMGTPNNLYSPTPGQQAANQQRMRYEVIENIKNENLRYLQIAATKNDATSSYWCEVCPHNNYVKPIPDFYEEKIAATRIWKGDWWYWQASMMERDLKAGPPAAVQMVVNINPLAAGYSAFNGTFGDGTDIMGHSQSKLGVGLNAAGAILPFIKFSGSYSVYQGFDKANDVRYVGITSRTPSFRFAEHLNSFGTGKEFLRYRVIDGATNLTKIQARIWEQNLINKYGLFSNGRQLLNEINSISPKYWWVFGIK